MKYIFTVFLMMSFLTPSLVFAQATRIPGPPICPLTLDIDGTVKHKCEDESVYLVEKENSLCYWMVLDGEEVSTHICSEDKSVELNPDPADEIDPIFEPFRRIFKNKKYENFVDRPGADTLTEYYDEEKAKRECLLSGKDVVEKEINCITTPCPQWQCENKESLDLSERPKTFSKIKDFWWRLFRRK
jgi:hypothetical protein